MSMKHKFSCLMILMVMLFGASGEIEGSAKVLTSVIDDTARAGVKTSRKAALKDFGLLAKVYGPGAVESGMAAMEKALLKGSKDTLAALLKASKSLGDDFVRVGTKSADDAMEEVAQNLKSMEKQFGKLDNFSAEDLAKGASKDVSKMSKGEFKDLLGKSTLQKAEQAAKMQEFNASKSMFGKTAYNAGAKVSKVASSARKAVSEKYSTMIGKSESALNKMTAKNPELVQTLKETRDILGNKSLSAEERSFAAREMANLEYKASTHMGGVMRQLGAGAGHLAPYGLGFVALMGTAVGFMLPSLYQSAMMAQQHHNALLQTYIPPTKFGNIVLQLPDSVINLENPSLSQFIYYGIPVANPGDKLSAVAQTMYPGVSGPDKNNKISKYASNSYAKAVTFGGAKNITIPRYNLDAQALSTLPIFVSYSTQSWTPWASNGIADAAFSQIMVNLNTGLVFYADGTAQGTPAVPIVGLGGSSPTVETFLATKYGQLKSAGLQATYTEFVDGFSASKGASVANPIANQFNCSCLENNKGVLSSSTLQTCSGSKGSTCLLSSALQQIAAGLAINSQGTVLTPDQDLASEVAKGALGQVIPIQGFGAQFDDILQMFPGAEKNALANSGVLTISLGTNLASATSVTVNGADPDNYAAKGIYVYQCQNTPLAKILRSQAGGSATASYVSQLTDYIVFLDANLNQVPLMAPVQDPKNYNFIKMGLNPAIVYTSTIVGNVDSSGNFTFLPQLNIQSPAALVAKGLPATFAPLYGLNAANGTLSINYNQNLPATIGTITQSLASNPKLGQQFKTMQTAMINLLTAGPFGKYNLAPVPAAMQPAIGGVNLVMYTGFNGFPVPQDASNAACTDVLIPLSAAGKTVTLPSSNIAQYYGLVTDITYNVNADGTIAVATNGLANSPLSQNYNASTKAVDWSIDASKASQFYWINKLTAMGKGSSASFAMPQPLLTFVAQARTAWIKWVQSVHSSSLSNQEFAGVTIPGTSIVCTAVNQQAIVNGLYLYSVSPNPSSLQQDYFVLTNSLAPQITDTKLGTISAGSATSAMNLLSVVSGQLYSSSGMQVKNSAGVAYAVNPVQLLQALNKSNPKAFSDALKSTLNVAVGTFVAAGSSIVSPFNFGGLQLGIYQADLSASNYLYINAAGAGTSANFSPSDYFITIDSASNPVILATQLSSKTQLMVSLVSGQIYGPSGVQATMPADQVSGLVAALSAGWRSGIAKQIAALTANLATAQKNQQQQTAAMQAAPVQNSGAVTWDQSAVANVIAGLASQNYLPNPYSSLKQDSASGAYVFLSPATADGTQFIYTFFDVPNSFVDSKGNAMHVGATYDDQGNLLRVMQGIELISMLQQYGVAVDSSGKQYLGANNMLPIMKLDPADTALKPGVSGKSMIYSNDSAFPLHGIVSPISYQNSKFYIYFNTIAQAYYAMQVAGSKISYIDIAGGNVYNQDGSAQQQLNPVALNSSGDMTDLLLPYLNLDSFVQCIVKNKNNQNVYSDFINLESNFEPSASDPATNNSCGLNALVSLDNTATDVSVSQMPFPDDATAMPDLTVANQYNVYWDESSTTALTYMINSAYQWQNLQILPIDMNSRIVANPLPAAQYNFARLIMKNNAPYACIFGNQLYAGIKASGKNSYTMTSGANSITLSVQLDNKTNVQYVSIIAAGVTYNYQYTFLVLSDAQLVNYKQNVWQYDVVADITGKISLVAMLPVDASGSVQLSSVSMESVVNPPSDQMAMDALNNNIGTILQDTVHGRFLVQVDETTYPYFAQEGYVDIETGVLFTSSGTVVNYTLMLPDLKAVLQQLSCAVVRNKQNVPGLMYYPAVRAASQVASPVQSATQTSITSSVVNSVPSQQQSQPSMQLNAMASQASANQTSSSYVGGNSYAQVVQPAAMNSNSSVSKVANPQIVALQQQNNVLQADIATKQAALVRLQSQASGQKNNPNIKNQIHIDQNAITVDNQQIMINNQQIAALQSSAGAVATQGRSTLLGRLSSQLKRSKRKK